MPNQSRVVCLSNVYDQHYHDVRGEEVARGLSLQKRRDLFHCLELAAGCELIVLSAPPKALARRRFKWLPAVTTSFAGHRQLFCPNWDGPKLRIPLSWFFYARHVFRHVRTGDVVVIDNYEFIYIVAARWLNLFRRVTFILDYEDGKHLIDRSWSRVLSALAEWAGRPLIYAALLANPKMGERLPSTVITEVIPGFIPQKLENPARPPAAEIRLLYSGSMDRTRGLDLLLAALPLLPEHGWRLDITGHGPLAEVVTRFVQEPRWRDRVQYHQSLPAKEYEALLTAAHVGLNCQRSSDPISDVTFPSKVFTYLAAGLLVLSSEASAVKQLCGNACCYYPGEAPEVLADALKKILADFPAACRQRDLAAVSDRYSIAATTARLQQLMGKSGALKAELFPPASRNEK